MANKYATTFVRNTLLFVFFLLASSYMQAFAAVTVSINPGTATLFIAGKSQIFHATVAGTTNTKVTWSINPGIGTINSGVYLPPPQVLGPQTVTVTATSVADPSKSASATISLNVVAVKVAPTTIMLSQGQQTTFAPTVTGAPDTRVTWSVAPAVGSIATWYPTYVAPAQIDAPQTVTVTATSVADPSKTAKVTVNLTPVGIKVQPPAITLSQGQTQNFSAAVSGSANTQVKWQISPSVGSVSPTGAYIAPAQFNTLQTVTVTATSAADTRKNSTATITLKPVVSVALSPAQASLSPAQAQPLTATVLGSANTGVSWSMSPNVGTLSGNGTTAIFTAPATVSTQQSVTITAASKANPSATAITRLTLLPPAQVLTTSPANMTLLALQTQKFSAMLGTSFAATTGSNSVTWSLSPAVGTINSTGVYTAPADIAAANQITVTATAIQGGVTQVAHSVITLRPGPRALVYCNFNSPSSPCASVGSMHITAANIDTGHTAGTNGLRVCYGSGCNGGSTISFNGGMSMQRGTIAFWFKLNNNNPTSPQTNIFTTSPGTPLVTGSFSTSLTGTISSIAAGKPTVLTLPQHGLSSGDLVQLSGAPDAWASINAQWTVKRIDANTFSIPLDSTEFAAFSGTAEMIRGGTVNFSYDKGGTFRTDPFFMRPGEWHHILWTWTIDQHQVYRDGVLVASYNSSSPFPYQDKATFKALTLGTTSNVTQDISIDEFGSYDYAFSTREVQALYGSQNATPPTPLDQHGLTASAVWGPGERKAKITIDSGNDYLGKVTKYDVAVYRDGVQVGSKTFPYVHQGYVEGLVDVLPTFDSGTYSVKATASGINGALGTVSSAPWKFAKPSWLGNDYGIDNSVPAPYWDPISSNGSGVDFNVVSRRYSFDGGFGLPMQITALNQPVLARPVTLDIQQGGSTLPIQPTGLSLKSLQPNEADWTGAATAGSVLVTTTGKLEYDGMALITLRLEPSGGPVNLDSIHLTTTLTNQNAKYLFASKDQPFWWYIWSIRPPQAPGEFNNNLTNTPQSLMTDNIFSVVFSDEDRGLQIFHNNMSGWQVNHATPWQRFIRESDGSVSYRCDLANQPFVLTEPIEITVGWMATPVKRLPSDWRIATGGSDGASAAPASDKEYAYDFTLGHTWRTFNILPTDLAAYKNATTIGGRSRNRKVLPFVNAHVLLPTLPATPAEMATIQAETLNDSWNSSPSRGEGDYWAWAMNRLLNDPVTPDAADGYYIDESFVFLPNTSLLTGAGSIASDGTHDYGLNILGARDMYKRLAKQLMKAGKSPNLWLHTTGSLYPQMWSHAMMTLDAERAPNGYYIQTDTLPGDHFDAWNDNNSLLDPAKPSRYGTWLLGMSAASKFGLIPVMWRGLECCQLRPYYELKQRKAECLYQMHDILQADQELNWWQPKANFGLDQPDVTFHGYQTQNEIGTSDPNLKVTYYKRSKSVLAYIANFGPNDLNGTMTLNLNAINPNASSVSAKDAETGAPLTSTGGKLNLNVGFHNCRVVQVNMQ